MFPDNVSTIPNVLILCAIIYPNSQCIQVAHPNWFAWNWKHAPALPSKGRSAPHHRSASGCRSRPRNPWLLSWQQQRDAAAQLLRAQPPWSPANWRAWSQKFLKPMTLMCMGDGGAPPSTYSRTQVRPYNILWCNLYRVIDGGQLHRRMLYGRTWVRPYMGDGGPPPFLHIRVM